MPDMLVSDLGRELNSLWAQWSRKRQENERVAFALDQTEKLHPGIRENFERGASKSWDADEWTRGAYATLEPGQMSSHCTA